MMKTIVRIFVLSVLLVNALIASTETETCVRLISDGIATGSETLSIEAALRRISANNRAKIEHIKYRMKTTENLPRFFVGEFLPSLDEVVHLIEENPGASEIIRFTATKNESGILSFFAARTEQNVWKILSIQKATIIKDQEIQQVAAGNDR